MGDVRFSSPYARVAQSGDRAAAIASLADEEVIAALAGASRAQDPLLANVLATEAMNRMTRARAIVQHAADGILALDASGNVSSMNPAAERYLGWTSAELRGRDAHRALHAADEAGAPIARDACPIHRSLRDVTLHEEEEPFTRKDGQHLRVSLTVAPVVREGVLQGAVVTFRPIGLHGRARLRVAARAAHA